MDRLGNGAPGTRHASAGPKGIQKANWIIWMENRISDAAPQGFFGLIRKNLSTGNNERPSPLDNRAAVDVFYGGKAAQRPPLPGRNLKY